MMRYNSSTSSSSSSSSVPSVATQILFPSLILLALTGFVCTHKIQAEEECLSSNVICYECDSRQDPNCADPFDFSPEATLNPQVQQKSVANEHKYENDYFTNQMSSNSSSSSSSSTTDHHPIDIRFNQQQANGTNSSTTAVVPVRQLKRIPSTAICHGCCVKLTSKTLDGATYVRRTCTTSLHINYFMVGLVCMKESGDRGKMCFCETDYCNAARANFQPFDASLVILLTTTLTLMSIFALSFHHQHQTQR